MTKMWRSRFSSSKYFFSLPNVDQSRENLLFNHKFPYVILMKDTKNIIFLNDENETDSLINCIIWNIFYPNYHTEDYTHV